MAEISVSGRMSVSTLKKQFKEAFGVTLRVYNGARFADEKATLASIRKNPTTIGGDLKIVGNMLCGNLEKKFKEIYGIKVQVANAEDTALVSDSITLGAAARG